MSHDAPDIVVRSAEPDDADALHRIYSGPLAIRGTLQLPFASRGLWRERLEKPRSGTWQLVAQCGDEIVGNIGLTAFLEKPRRRHAGTIGMAVADEWHGRGVGTKLMQAALDLADNWIGLRRLELEVFADNEPAIRLYEKFGFVREGTCRQFALRDGEYVDVLLMARLV
jgi:L-phenylalanine/L-methionine N-acetyltransferase